MTEYRVEKKYLVSDMDLALLAARLDGVMEKDIHQQGDCYQIRSLYFDDLRDSCLEENDAGVDYRKKYRIRTYDPATGFLRLEIKEKKNGLTKKISCPLASDEYGRLVQGDPVSFDEKRIALNELLLQTKCTSMRPKVIISYERTAFVHPTGNVRITFDRNISASGDWEDFLLERVPDSVPVLPAGMHVLEVKYDELLPDVIRRQLELGKLRQTAFSKYYLGRMAVDGEFPVSW